MDVRGGVDLTDIAAANGHERPGIKGLAQDFGHAIQKPKSVTLSNWAQGRLTPAQASRHNEPPPVIKHTRYPFPCRAICPATT